MGLPPPDHGPHSATRTAIAPPHGIRGDTRLGRRVTSGRSCRPREEPAAVFAGRDPQDAQERASHRVGPAEPAFAGDPFQARLRFLQEPAGRLDSDPLDEPRRGFQAADWQSRLGAEADALVDMLNRASAIGVPGLDDSVAILKTIATDRDFELDGPASALLGADLAAAGFALSEDRTSGARTRARE